MLDHDTNHDHRVDIDDLQWQYLQGDGDSRSAEVSAPLQVADLVITNPPFSLFREFLAWLMDAHKQFAIIGNMNAITYKEVFPLIKENRVWLGCHDPRLFFQGHASGELYEAAHTRWYTNIEHGRRHAPLQLMTMADNLKFSRHRAILEQGYPEYDNYQAIEVPYSSSPRRATSSTSPTSRGCSPCLPPKTEYQPLLPHPQRVLLHGQSHHGIA